MMERLRPRADLWLSLAVFILVLFGLAMVYSAGISAAINLSGKSTYFLSRQLLFLLAGSLLWLVAAMVDYHNWRRWGVWLFAASMLLLLPLALHLVRPINGAYRWYDLRIFNLQPTEVLKLGFTCYLAALFTNRRGEMTAWQRTVVPFAGTLALIGLFIMRQPDLGTLLIVVLISFAIFYAAGAKVWQLGLGLSVMVALVSLLIIVEPYRVNRLKAFLNPMADVQNTGYHNQQALIAIGSGGLFGRGFGHSIQKTGYLPEPQTDSIFAVTVEELGYIRSLLPLMLYAIIAWRGYAIAARAPDRFGQLLAAGLTVWLIGQAILNIAAMLQLVPLTGVPLPFMSYGGSSLLMNLLAVGILLSISKQAGRD